MSMLKLLRLALALALFNAAAALAQEDGSDAGHQLKLSTYEVGDLVVNVPDYALQTGQTNSNPQPGGFSGGMGGGMMGRGMGGMMGGMLPSEPGRLGPGVAPVTIPSLIEAIRTMVAPDTWQGAPNAGMNDPSGMGMMGAEGGMGMEMGGMAPVGGQGQITHLGATLIIRQTREVHQQIGQLLESLRGGSAMRRTISIDARWLLLTSDELDQLTPASDDVQAEQPKVDRQVLAELTRRPTSLRGITSCFSGQAVYLISGTLRSSVSSYIPVVGSLEADSPAILAGNPSRHDFTFAAHRADPNAHDDLITLIDDERLGVTNGRSVGYQPVITTNNFGVQIELRPTLLQGEQAAIVDLKSTVTFPGSPAPSEPGRLGPGAELAPAVDRVAIQTQELATTLRLPLGQPVLVGGMTYMAAAGDTFVPGALPEPVDPQGGGEQRQLYLVLELK